ncbi:hypothetical protein EJ04DRAFT_559707 [Polyplosphaeria fusca]|uniref:Anoctamin n=1 Tax=Polyplosphaeria fusca TaxID=682080 RepID=A0A9P4RAC1_9PLEO|nr:hypothetical protein EJ04DRAFT_559707 [Polyplosphaeria fusca]
MRLQRVGTSLDPDFELGAVKYHDKYVVVYDFSTVDIDVAINEFSILMKDLEAVGLHTEVRTGYDQTLLVFVQAPRDLLGNTVYRSRVKDWLYGVVKDHPGGTKNSVVDGDFEAEDVLSMYHLVNWQQSNGGAGIVPQTGKWENVASIFPLHNHRKNQELMGRLSRTIFLSEEDLDRIRDLWGSKVAFYFAFLQTYFLFLTFPCAAGVLAWAFLPKYSLGFALIVGVWCTVFIEYWKIKEVDLSIRWGVRGVGGLKVNRPQFVYEREFVDSGGRVIHYFPRWKRITRQLCVIPFIMVSTLLLGLLIVIVFAMETLIGEVYNGPYKFYLEYLPTVALAVFLPYISNGLESIAAAMTEYENHRTADYHEMSLTQKIFVLNSVTNYLPIFLTAFVYIPFGHRIIPQLQHLIHDTFQLGDTKGNFVFESDTDRLRNEVIALTVTGQLSSAFEELALPYLKMQFHHWYRNFKSKRSRQHGEVTQSDGDDPSERRFLRRARRQGAMEAYDVQEDIAEMVLQYGYLALFSPVWPLIPIGFLVNNWFELRGDVFKICVEHQRPAPVRSDGLGPWVSSLELLTWLGSMSSAAIVHLFDGRIHGLYQSTGVNKWCSLPLTVFFSEHIFLGFRAAVRFALQRIGSQQIRRERAEKYAERKRLLDDLEASSQKSAHLDVGERERRKSIRLSDSDLFWTRQTEQGASQEAGVGMIKASKKSRWNASGGELKDD